VHRSEILGVPAPWHGRRSQERGNHMAKTITATITAIVASNRAADEAAGIGRNPAYDPARFLNQALQSFADAKAALAEFVRETANPIPESDAAIAARKVATVKATPAADQIATVNAIMGGI
jgi:hypothetical protein